MNTSKILIVDDNKNVLEALKMLLQDEFTEVHALKNPNQLLSTIREKKIDLVLLDMNFKVGTSSGNEGIYWLQEIKKNDPSIEVVMLTAYGDVELAVKALKKGACDFILKPWENDKLLATLGTASKLRQSNLKVKELSSRERDIRQEMNRPIPVIGNSQVIKRIKEVILKVARTDANILLTGENGTGKEVIAREIHRQSHRAGEFFVPVDIASLPGTLLESELFGHKKGAFTGASEDRTGKFRMAHRGTLFLDEIGNIPLQLQSKLLVILQNRIVTPLGTNDQIPVDFRLVCATNSNLEELIQEGNFREDLFYRINTIHLEIPPLRQRIEDIEKLANHFLKSYSTKYNKPNLRLGQQSLKKLQKYHWPGNARELEHAIEKAVILSDSHVITPDSFFFKNTQSLNGDNFTTLEEMETSLIKKALDDHGGNLSHAAKQLGITRQTLYNKLKKYDL
ncbi:MAG: sigma-54-dependent transcriptional regulator [Bacteroidales bacterium]